MARRSQLLRDIGFGLADDLIRTIRAADDLASLRSTCRAFADELRCRYFAIVTHEDLRNPGPGAIDLRDYPEEACRRIIGQCLYRRDTVMRGAIFADAPFIWSEMTDFMTIDHQDRIFLELGRREGLNEGITIPCSKLGYCLGSCTFAGFSSTRHAELVFGPAQMFGIFAFQRARRLAGPGTKAPLVRIPPRYHDSIVLVGQGLKVKTIAHRLGLSEDTVESYIRDARHLLGACDKTELVAAALLTGAIGLDELRHS